MKEIGQALLENNQQISEENEQLKVKVYVRFEIVIHCWRQTDQPSNQATGRSSRNNCKFGRGSQFNPDGNSLYVKLWLSGVKEAYLARDTTKRVPRYERKAVKGYYKPRRGNCAAKGRNERL